jgi:Sulfate permease family
MLDSSFAASPRWQGLQDLQQQRRRSEVEGRDSFSQRRLRAAYFPHETDFLMSSILPNNDDSPTSHAHDRGESTFQFQPSNHQPSFSGSGKAARSSMLDVSTRRGASSIVDVREEADKDKMQAFLNDLSNNIQSDQLSENANSADYDYGSCQEPDGQCEDMFQSLKGEKKNVCSKPSMPKKARYGSLWSQLPAIVVASLLNLMLAIPFGVSYFPIGWSVGGGEATITSGDPESGVAGAFPLSGKEALGIRMCLFSALVGQLIMTWSSKFDSPICFQMIENVPFYHTLANIVIRNQGYGMDSLSTLFFLFGLSSCLVGILFYLLGRLDLGRVVYFVPNHVLVGCIGGIGVFIIISALEVTNNQPFTWDMDGLQGLVDNFHLLGVVLLFEGTLRLLTWKTKSRIPLLSPIFFCSIPFVFYAVLWIFRVDMATAKQAGYFFPAPADEDANVSLFDRALSPHTLDLVRMVNFRTISWRAVYESFGTLVALSAFSLIHVPINIPYVSFLFG